MRMLFTSVPAHGHLLPLRPLMEAALDEGHRVAVMIGASSRDVVRDELPEGVEHLAVGPPQIEVAREVVRRTGVDVMRPTTTSIGEMFGGVLLDDADEAVAAARAWRPGVIVAEIGGAVSAVLADPGFRARAADVAAEIAAAVEPRDVVRALART